MSAARRRGAASPERARRPARRPRAARPGRAARPAPRTSPRGHTGARSVGGRAPGARTPARRVRTPAGRRRRRRPRRAAPARVPAAARRAATPRRPRAAARPRAERVQVRVAAAVHRPGDGARRSSLLLGVRAGLPDRCARTCSSGPSVDALRGRGRRRARSATRTCEADLAAVGRPGLRAGAGARAAVVRHAGGDGVPRDRPRDRAATTPGRRLDGPDAGAGRPARRGPGTPTVWESVAADGARSAGRRVTPARQWDARAVRATARPDRPRPHDRNDPVTADRLPSTAVPDRGPRGARRAARPSAARASSASRRGASAVARSSSAPRPRLDDGTPFPTTYYLTLPAARSRRSSTLEAGGLMKEMTARLAEDERARRRLPARARGLPGATARRSGDVRGDRGHLGRRACRRA